MSFVGVVMAAGEGRRMRSRIPKPLHPICGKAMVQYPVELLLDAGATRVVVVVSPGNSQAIQAHLGDSVDYAIQQRADGTGGAVSACWPLLAQEPGRVVVIGGDTPLVSRESLTALFGVHETHGASMSLLSASGSGLLDHGRLALQGSRVAAIVEASELSASSDLRDAPANAGVYCFDAKWLGETLPKLSPRQSGELYLTDLALIGDKNGAVVVAAEASCPNDALGVNDRVQLSQAEAAMRQRIRERLMLGGVTMFDPGSIYIDADVSIGMDSVILPNTMLLGRTAIGEDCEIGPNSVIRDSEIGDNCRVTASAIEEATLEKDTDVGPFSHLRPGAHLETGVHIGNFVEVKQSRFKAGAVMGHFGYAGDATIGERVNIGAGMVTCNYDGKDKHRTEIEDDAFIGCDTMLVAPVTVGSRSVTGAGAVVTRDIPPARLAVGVPATIRSEVG